MHRNNFRLCAVSVLGEQRVQRRPDPPAGAINSSSSRASSATALSVYPSLNNSTHRLVVETTHLKLPRAQQGKATPDPGVLRYAEKHSAWLMKLLTNWSWL